jgi:TRAP-type uncharacterized transport system substrate-binding protein
VSWEGDVVKRTVIGKAAALVMFSVALLAPGAGSFGQEARPTSRYDETKRAFNENTVTIVTAGQYCTSTRFAEDMRNVLNDMTPGGLRILPVLGVGGAQNLADLLFVKGIDLVIVEQDLLGVLREKDPGLYKNIGQQVQYITKLFDSEFHLVTTSSVRSYDELRGKKVNFYLKDSMTAIAAENIFRMLDIPVEPTYYDEDMALRKLMSGELAAIAFLEGAPRPFVDRLKTSDGFRLLPLDEQSLPGRDLTELFERYMPTDLTHDHYPNLIAPGQVIPTVSNSVLLATYNWPRNSERYKKIANFTQKLFSNIEKLQDDSRHPKWRLINVAANVPGWTRFQASKGWLDSYDAEAAADEEMLPAFESFLGSRKGRKPAKDLTSAEKKALFMQFKDFWNKEKARAR